MNAKDIELHLARHLDCRKNLIVPNAAWGMGLHECDLLVLSKHGYLTEIEIKISKHDLKKDLEKRHGHKSNKIKYLYFAIPSHLAKHIDLIPIRAGVFIITSTGRVVKIADAQANIDAKKIGDDEKYKLARLAVLRMWDMRKTIKELKQDKKDLIKKIKELEK